MRQPPVLAHPAGVGGVLYGVQGIENHLCIHNASESSHPWSPRTARYKELAAKGGFLNEGAPEGERQG